MLGAKTRSQTRSAALTPAQLRIGRRQQQQSKRCRDISPVPAKRRKLELEDLATSERLDMDDLPREKACGRFEILDELGGGAYGIVYRAKDMQRDGEIVALKKLVVREEAHIGIPPHIMREVANLQYLSSRKGDYEPQIVSLLDMEYTDGRYAHEMILYLVFEHMEQDLDCYIRRHSPRGGLSESTAKDFLHQILMGVDWMHVNNIVHRDLKPQNILVSHDGKIKIADFGLSRIVGPKVVLSTQVITQWYRAPEVLLHSSYCKPVDIWSVGCVLAEMYCGKPLFDAEKTSEMAQLEKIFSIVGTPSREEWPEQSSITLDQFTQCRAQSWAEVLPAGTTSAETLLSRMLVLKPDNRVTAQDALRDIYFHSKTEGAEEDVGVCNSPGGASISSLSTLYSTNSISSLQYTTLDNEDGASLDSGIY